MHGYATNLGYLIRRPQNLSLKKVLKNKKKKVEKFNFAKVWKGPY